MRILVREPMSEDTRISIRLHLQNFSAGKAAVDSDGSQMVVDFTEAGDDNPEGRRANRRTEIYLDFD